MRKILVFCAAVLLLPVLLLFAPAQAAPKAELWSIWEAHAPDSTRRVDHQLWDELLARYIVAGSTSSNSSVGINLFDYAAVSAADKQQLVAYLMRLATVPVAALTRDEQRAYWINLYNALTVDVVLQHYPVDSIRDISSGLFASGPWSEKRFRIGDVMVSLDDIEHRILRPIWRDARLHYAVNCASLGCPNLARRAYTADNSEQLLDDGARAYVNHPRGAQFSGDALTVSSIYDWFSEDFGGDEAGVLKHLARYADDALAQRLVQQKAIDGYEYDWSLNAPGN